jgi:drug/metabolite transporter (DMT)-like permease
MARLWVFGAALLFSTGGAAIKGNALTSWQVTSFRSLIAVIVLSLLFPRARHGWSPRLVLLGLCYAVTLITFVAATRLTTAANAIFLQATAPAYLVVLSPLLLREHLKKSDAFLLAGCALGMAMFFIAAEPPRATAPDPFLGNLIAVFCGVTWALTMLGLRSMARQGTDGGVSSMSMVITGNWLTFLLALPAALPLPAFRLHDLIAILWLGIFQVGFAYVCLTRALQRLPAFEVATLLLIEPAMNPVWTWLALGERPAPLAIAGGAVILTTTLINTWWNSRQPQD